MGPKNIRNFRGMKPKDIPVPPPPFDSIEPNNSPSLSTQHLPYKPSILASKSMYNNQRQKHVTTVKIANVAKQTKLNKNIEDDVTASQSFNLLELQFQAQLLSDLQSLEPIIDLPSDEDSLGIEWTYTKLDNMLLNNRNYHIRVDKKNEEDDQINSGDITPNETNVQSQLTSQHSISSNDSNGHDFNSFTYWLIKGKQNDLSSVETMVKTAGFNYLDVPRNLLPIAAQVCARAFFDPSYRTYLDQMDESIY
ncbi:hypothetical protein BMR1_02g03225 [Babesia microti strain RI]|uniref:Uncharacterized protein n=1 Tax=Babesia microti (strain RI) TaxID=1133968 RepID=I7I8W5_BABMR|nr:hypothetical protein BMR1_02g03225 [Babesia microti strain RI]CCF73798.1 hypothetical protein BMR1_02g03225 [Babesia microti strain RI]|eukprot:XP_012648407.1 hypothetical protein BMR1_02g03225 [Babesia microti strain RI]